MNVGRGMGRAQGCAPSVRQRMVQLCLLRDCAERLHCGGPQVEVAVSTGNDELGVAGTRGHVLQDSVLRRCPVCLVQQSVALVGGGSGKPKRVLGVLSAYAQTVLKPSQGHLVDHLCCARGESRGPLAICVSRKVENDLGGHRMDPRRVNAVLQGEGGGQSLPVGHLPEIATAHVRVSSAARATLVACLQGLPPDASEEVLAPGLGDQVVPVGAESAPLRSADCHGTSGWPGDSWLGFSARVLSGRIAGWLWSRTSALAIVLAQDQSAFTCSLSHAGPPRWCTTRCHVSSGWSSSVCTAMCWSCGTSVATSRMVLWGSPRGLGWPAPTCTIRPISPRSCACSVARAHWSSVVTNHTGVGAWGRGRRGSGLTTSALGSWCSPSASTLRRMYRKAAGGWYAAPCVGGDRLP